LRQVTVGFQSPNDPLGLCFLVDDAVGHRSSEPMDWSGPALRLGPSSGDRVLIAGRAVLHSRPHGEDREE
jgi:hypothetical protein